MMDVSERIQDAFAHFCEGDLKQAESICREMLNVSPDDADVLHLLGMICFEKQDYASGKRYIEKSIRIKPDEAYAYFNLANILREERKIDEAIVNYRKALGIDPCLSAAYYNLGIIFREEGQTREAIACFEKAVQTDPGDAGAYNNLGIVLQREGRLDDAISSYQNALKIRGDDARIYYNLAIAFNEQRQFDRAIAGFKEAIRLNPQFADAYNDLGTSLKEKGLLDEAISSFQETLQLNPDRADTFYNLGIVFKEKGLFDDAIGAYQKAIQLNPYSVDTYNNLGIVFQDNRQLDEAIECYRKALSIDPDDAVTHWNLSHVLLLSGNFKDGWREYEWRLKVRDFHKPDFQRPLWDGSDDIRGRTVLLHAEQGFGDTIQFIRYAPLVAATGAEVIVKCHKELTSLLQNVEGVRQAVSYGEHLPGFDTYCFLPSLPLIFGTISETIPVKIPYIKVDPYSVQRWRERLKDDDSRLKVGLVWAGREQRSCSSDLFLPLGRLTGITFYSLQKGEPARQAENSHGVDIIDYMGDINDFSDTAALIENLDLIITVDTAVAHLSGALGKPVWTLLPAIPDWRWMLDREDSPWYPTMRLFRQPCAGDWGTVMHLVTDELGRYAETLYKRRGGHAF